MTGRNPGVEGSNNPLVQDKRTTHCLTAGATSKADGSVNGKTAAAKLL